MTTYSVYEDFTNLLGGKEHKRIGTVEAKSLKSAVNKAKKQFKCVGSALQRGQTGYIRH